VKQKKNEIDETTAIDDVTTSKTRSCSLPFKEAT
jgi:hypothetical protein